MQEPPSLVEQVQEGQYFPVTMILLIIGLSLPADPNAGTTQAFRKKSEDNIPGKVFCVDQSGREITLVVWKNAVMGKIRELVTQFKMFCTYKFENMEVKRDVYKGKDLGACLHWNTGASKAQRCAPTDGIPLRLYPKTSLEGLYARSMLQV